jgi:hypothetical protein
VQETIERLVNVERFNMASLCDAAWPLIEAHPDTRAQQQVLKDKLGDNYRDLCSLILRNVFLIELVKVPKIESTKVRIRWYEQLGGDSRECSFEECLAIAAQLLTELRNWLQDASHEELIKLFFAESILPYEAPLDYRERPQREDAAGRIHRLGNLDWVYDDLMLRTLKLRKFLRAAETSPDAEFFKRVLDDKIKIKTYLTDRALTGPYKTNREKRWETHPQSVQFATRRTCLEIEYKLVTQLCAFEGFPPRAREVLQAQGILPEKLDVLRCPVTQEPLSFPLFRDALMNPQHGKSEFQIGHLNPLKLDEPGSDFAGHTADNISWISEDGNRIQGPLSLTSVRQLLRRIAANYDQLGLV